MKKTSVLESGLDEVEADADVEGGTRVRKEFGVISGWRDGFSMLRVLLLFFFCCLG